MKRRSQKKRFLVLPILIVFISSILLAFGSGLFTTSKSQYFDQLSKGWSFYHGKLVYHGVSLSDIKFGNLKKGEVITISNTIPATDIIVPTIMFKSSLAAVSVKIDGKEVYSFGREYSDKGLFVPKKYNMITIDDGTRSHEIRISFTVAENNGFKGIYPVHLGTKRELVQNFMQGHRLAIFVGAFFVMYACLLFSLGVFLSLYGRKEISVFSSAVISLLLGIYTYAYNDIFCFVSDHDYFLSLLEYGALFLIPVTFSVLLYSIHPNIANLRQRIIIGVNIFFPVIFWIFHFTGIAHINIFVIPMQLVIVMEIILILPKLVSGLSVEHKEKIESDTYTGIDADNYLLLGFILMIIFVLLEIVKYSVSRFNGESRGIGFFASVDLLNLGMLYFIICLFIYYFLNGIDHMNSNRVKKELEGLAYTDALTGLMNRAKCMQYAAAISGDYAVVSLDLDQLKYVNDTFGHIEGDRMIKAFADLLVKAFSGASLIGRTGGDEFLVAFENPAADVCDKCIQALERSMEEFNKGDGKFTLSASAGYAYSYEAAEGEYEEVFFLADSRMYEMKETHHA